MLRRDPRDLVVVIAPGLVAALACAIAISGRSLWLDEGATVAIASQHGDALWSAVAHDGGNMLLYYLFLHVWMAIFGQGELALRLPSLIAAALIAGCTAELARRLFASRGAALGAGLLAGVSVGVVFWGQDARGYAPMAAAATFSFLALVMILESPEGEPPPPHAALGYVIATGVALYIGFDAILIVPAQLAITALVGRRMRTVVGALSITAALCIPLLVLAIARGSSQLFWVGPVSLTSLWDAALMLLSAGYAPNFSITPLTVILALVSAAALGGGLWLIWIATQRRGDRILILLPVLWVVVPALIAVVAALAGEPVELDRSAILLIPGVSLVLTWLVWRAGAPLAWGGAGLAVVLALRVLTLVPTYDNSPEPWKTVAKFVLGHSQRGDCVAFYPQDGRMAFGYYVRHTPGANHRAPIPVLPTGNWRTVKSFVEDYTRPMRVTMSQWAKTCPRLWVISSHAGSAHGTKRQQQNAAGLVYINRGLDHRYAVHKDFRFGHAAQISVRLYGHHAV